MMEDKKQKPIIPGHSCEYDIAEMAFKNGKEHMREAVIDKLFALKGRAMGAERFAYDIAIEAVRKLEVRP